jgi:hypothetical protein
MRTLGNTDVQQSAFLPVLKSEQEQYGQSRAFYLPAYLYIIIHLL